MSERDESLDKKLKMAKRNSKLNIFSPTDAMMEKFEK